MTEKWIKVRPQPCYFVIKSTHPASWCPGWLLRPSGFGLVAKNTFGCMCHHVFTVQMYHIYGFRYDKRWAVIAQTLAFKDRWRLPKCLGQVKPDEPAVNFEIFAQLPAGYDVMAWIFVRLQSCLDGCGESSLIIPRSSPLNQRETQASEIMNKKKRTCTPDVCVL